MESIQEYKGKYRWPLMDIVNDLVEQGGIRDEDLEVTREMNLRYREHPIIFTHDYKQGLILSSNADLGDLVEAFSRILELKPFCKYTLATKNAELVTYEWNKVNSMMRYFDLKEDYSVKSLKRV